MRYIGIGALALLLLSPASGWALEAETQAAKGEETPDPNTAQGKDNKVR
ncbi:hypothetical protein [Billgrantia kenyensis]|uniref:Uncharacterized protein n=1 Tax=Billgrantia kenyensis TaxID=321266 RepID=A0A7V9VZ05_9GAMM|nr:hypothetical protein [Halomonas kenyensis]MBA2778034.1 hypothetical protein [Halomonas kenyensis]MCG6661187.1 hypothetical protein [Halomonas kenyensis]